MIEEVMIRTLCCNLCKHSENQRGGWGGGSPPHDARRSDDSAKGALITVNLLQISGVGEEGQVQISQQAQHFSKVRYRFAAGAILSQGAVQISRQAQHFRKRYQFSRQAQHFRKVRGRV